MANKMLIDAAHPEETRVVVLRGNRVEEFDFESAHRKQLRGNIYLAKVTRVEPSLQAAFVDYGGNRHGFLAFSEIHPDYYQIPVADRQALIDEEGRAQRAAEDEADRRSRRHHNRDRSLAARRDDEVVRAESTETPTAAAAAEQHRDAAALDELAIEDEAAVEAENTEGPTVAESVGEIEREQNLAAEREPGHVEVPASERESETGELPIALAPDGAEADDGVARVAPTGNGEASEEPAEAGASADVSGHNDGAENGHENETAEEMVETEEVVESVGGADALEEVPDRAPRYRRQYKIQEVIKRRQVMLVQVVKEERGTKGAALTTYLSLAGRYSVLMPNTARGGGISRKITSADDRARLKEIAQELEVPEGMGVILRTAGAARTKIEIKRDFEYLLRLWETVRDLTLKSTAPKLVYEEGSLVKRSIRDLYSKDIDEVIVAGSEAYQEAKDFMRMLMPSHAKNVKLYADAQPLLSRYGVENQLDGMFSPVVQLRSGGYIVLNQAEALVAIDVNSGRATREHHIEDTALKTNLEAADEIARQLRLRDLAGLIVIDFIDMDEKRNNRAVERRLKECLKQDRARIQVGRISHFGLLEMSRQRIRASVLESSTEKCPYCGGSGHVRSVSSLALQVLRALEEQLIKGATHNLIVRTRRDVALYVLNHKRAHLRALEERFSIVITINADDTLIAPQAFAIDRGDQVHTLEAAKALAERAESQTVPLEEEDELEEPEAIGEPVDAEDDEAPTATAAPAAADNGRRRRRRHRRGGRNGGEAGFHAHASNDEDTAAAAEAGVDGFADASIGGGAEDPDQTTADRGEMPRDGERRRRRRGRRGGRRNRMDRDHHEATPAWHDQEASQPQHSETTAEDLLATPAAETDLTEAVADLDGASPSPAPAPAPVPSPAFSGPPAAESPAVSSPSPVEESAPRRRSTVREPAPSTANTEPAQAPSASPGPAPEPVITETGDTETTDRPRRSGWWSRRFAGG
jgi:ribonuclease E